MQEEIWKDVPGFEGFYKVSNYGNIISKTGRYRKPVKNNNGYWYLNLYKNGKYLSLRIHQIVALAFLEYNIGQRIMVVDHIDNNKDNNNLSNLQIINHRDNIYKDLKNKSSKYIGVSKSGNKWRSVISKKNKSIHIGYFNTELEASKAYHKKRKEIDN